jgi:hypothetical protein
LDDLRFRLGDRLAEGLGRLPDLAGEVAVLVALDVLNKDAPQLARMGRLQCVQLCGADAKPVLKAGGPPFLLLDRCSRQIIPRSGGAGCTSAAPALDPITLINTVRAC